MLTQAFILIGQAPNRLNDPRAALMGRLGQKLCELFGCSLDDYVAYAQRFNVVPRWTGKQGKGDHFPLALARQNARRMRYSLSGCRVLFIGMATAEVFGVFHQPLKWKPYRVADDHPGIFRAAILPHPSGVNLWWNDICHRAEAAIFMHNAWRRYAGR